LGFAIRSPELQEREGKNKAAVWKKDGSMIAVCVRSSLLINQSHCSTPLICNSSHILSLILQTTDGHLHIYNVAKVAGSGSSVGGDIEEDDNANIFSYDFNVMHHYLRLPAKRRLNVTLSHACMIEHGGANWYVVC